MLAQAQRIQRLALDDELLLRTPVSHAPKLHHEVITVMAGHAPQLVNQACLLVGQILEANAFSELLFHVLLKPTEALHDLIDERSGHGFE